MSLLKKISSKPVSKMRAGDIVNEMLEIVIRDPIVVYPIKSMRDVPSYSKKDYLRYQELKRELNKKRDWKK